MTTVTDFLNHITTQYHHIDGDPCAGMIAQWLASPCVWRSDGETWRPECGADPFFFLVGGPLENGFVHCPFCGKPLGEMEVTIE